MLGGSYGATLVPTSVGWSNRVVIMVTTHFGLLSGLAIFFRAIWGHAGTSWVMKEHFGYEGSSLKGHFGS